MLVYVPYVPLGAFDHSLYLREAAFSFYTPIKWNTLLLRLKAPTLVSLNSRLFRFYSIVSDQG